MTAPNPILDDEDLAEYDRQEEAGPGLEPGPDPGRATEPADVILASHEAEAAILGALLIDPSAYPRVQGLLTGATFFHAPHATLFRAIADVIGSGAALDHVSLRNHLVAIEKLDEVGGHAYLGELVDVVSTAANIEHYASIVVDLKARRDALGVLDATAIATRDRRQDVGSVMASAVDGLLRAIPADPNAAEPIRETLWAAMTEIEERWNLGSRVIGLPSGVDNLDHITLGFKESELIVVAARPSMGKTAFAVNVIRHLAGECDHMVGMFSLEMTRKKIVARILANEARVDLPETYGKDTARDLAATRLAAAAGRVQHWPVLIDDRRDLTAAQIRFQVDRWTRDQKTAPSLVVVDYLSLMGDRDTFERHDLKVGARVRDLRNLICKTLGIPLILLHQLSREVTKGEKPRRPRLSDLRDSGEIEQHADVVIFIHPTGETGGHATDGRVELLVEKHRDGPTGIVDAKFRRETGRFSAWRQDQRGIE
jgi:replicative DNA helicase